MKQLKRRHTTTRRNQKNSRPKVAAAAHPKAAHPKAAAKNTQHNAKNMQHNGNNNTGNTSGKTILRHVGSGKYSDVFKVTTPGSHPVIMKVSYYRDDTVCDFLKRAKRGDVEGAMEAKRRDAIQVSSAFSKLSMSLMQKGVSPHFVMMYCEADCKSFADRLAPLLTNRLKELTPAQRKNNNVCFMEVFTTNMTKFLVTGKYDEALLRAMIFQVLYTLAALQKLLPGFRHNDLSTNNVLVKTLRVKPLLSYTFGGATYFVRSSVLVALSDYDFTNVPNRPGLVNERVHSGKYKVDGRRNDSYDTHFFMKSVLKCIQTHTAKFPKTTAFIKSLRLQDEDRQNARVFTRLVPATLLKNAYFAPLKQKPAGSVVGAAYAA